MAEMTVSSSQGKTAEWHDKRVITPKNADKALQDKNEHWIGDLQTTDEDKFNAIFSEDVEKFNAKQSRPSRKMGAESTNPNRQKSYYEGVVDGTFCHGKGDMKENPIEEVVLQIGNKDDNGITDTEFDINTWKTLKMSGHEKEASEYAIAHLNKDVSVERTKRILKRAVNRIKNLDPEHLIVIRANYHGDEVCGTGHVHLACVLRATGYKNGMESRVAMVKALEQMGFKKTKDSEFGIVQLHEKFKDLIEEEMVADALEYGYEAIQRKADSGEHRKRSDVDVFREMAAEREELSIAKEDLNEREKTVFAREQRNVHEQKNLTTREKNLADSQSEMMTLYKSLLQGKADLDERENNLVERENSLAEREISCEYVKNQNDVFTRNLTQRERKITEKENDILQKGRELEAKEKRIAKQEESVILSEKTQMKKAEKMQQREMRLAKQESLLNARESDLVPANVVKGFLIMIRTNTRLTGLKQALSSVIDYVDKYKDGLNGAYKSWVTQIHQDRQKAEMGEYFDVKDDEYFDGLER